MLFNLLLRGLIERMTQQHSLAINGNHTLLLYVDDIVIMGDTKQYITNSRSCLIRISRYVGLSVNDDITIIDTYEMVKKSQT